MKPLVEILEREGKSNKKIMVLGKVYYSVREAARILGVSRDEVYGIFSDGGTHEVFRITPRGRIYVSEREINSIL